MKYKIVITIILALFSFLYLKNAAYFVRENDELMKTIKEKQSFYNKEATDAIITYHTMIPGIKGKKINLVKSYNHMKTINSFQESLIIYDLIKPNKSIIGIYDKVIISGNPKKKNISIIINDNKDYCYTTTLDIDKNCIKEKKYTIYINKISSNYLTKTKELVRNGIILFYEFGKQNNELNIITKYLKNNGYNIVSIKELISE